MEHKMTPVEYGEKNDFSTVRVPVDKRMSAYSITMVIVGLIIALSALYTGASFSEGLNLREMLIADLAGNVILCFYAGLMGIIGARENMSVTMLSRHSFGRIGSGLISAIVAISLSGWFAWQCNFFGQTIHAMFPAAGMLTDPKIAAVWGGLLMMTTAYVGTKGLSFLSNFAAPLILVISIIAIGIATNSVGGWQQLSIMSEANTSETLTVSTATVAVVGAFATGGIIQPDVTRYSKTWKQSLCAALGGFLVAQFVVIAAGYIICVASGTSDVASALLIILGGFSLVVLIFAQWTTNDNNLYSSSLAICALFPKFNKHIVVLVLGLGAIVCGFTGIINSFVGFLSFLGILVPPVGGIIIADYFVLKKASYQFGEGTRYGFLSLAAFIAWIASVVVGFSITWGIACINSMVVAFVVYLILELCFKNNPDKKYIGGFCVEDDYGETTRSE